MIIIAAVDRAWGLGYKGKQTIILPEDRKFFKEITSGGVVIAGRKTFEDFPGALPDRKNIILTRNLGLTAKGVTVLSSLKQVLAEVENEDPAKVFIAGGGEIYRQFLPMCEKAYITKLETVTESDTYLPNLDELETWSTERKIKSGESCGIHYTFEIYKNTQPEPYASPERSKDNA
ncbi:MAG: dihydrofolate reductase [Oscillospiraceae bacterium]|nr:dihydrofolate reductase [Oscillospiraceae bacterium]